MHHHLSVRQKVIIMIAVMSAMFLVALDQTIISTALGKIVQDFNAFTSLSLVVTAYLLTTTITVPIAGKLSDIFGRRTILLIGVGIFVIGSLLSGISGNIDQLIWFRALQGIGGGIITANAFTIIGDLFEARERGRWSGFIGAVFALASVVGPLLGGFLTEPHNIFGLVTSWRWTFFINIPIGVAAFIIVAIFSPSLRHAAKARIDVIGAALLAAALGTLVLAVDNTDKVFADFLSSTGWSLLTLRLVMYAVVVVATVALIMVERLVTQPIINLRFFRNRNFVLIMSIALLQGAAFLGSILYLTQFNQQVFGASPTQSGLMLLPLIGGIMTVSIATGQIVARTGRYKIILLTGFIIATIAIALLSTLVPTSPYWYEAIIMFFAGAGLGAAMPIINLAVQNEFEQKDLGTATSSSQLFRSLGSTVGTAVFGSMLTAGVIAGIGSVSSDAYIKQLTATPQGAQVVGDTNDANNLLNLNTPDIKSRITDGFTTATAKLPAPAKTAAQKQFDNQPKRLHQKDRRRLREQPALDLYGGGRVDGGGDADSRWAERASAQVGACRRDAGGVARSAATRTAHSPPPPSRQAPVLTRARRCKHPFGQISPESGRSSDTLQGRLECRQGSGGADVTYANGGGYCAISLMLLCSNDTRELV